MPVRAQPAVADGGQGLHAEEETLLEPLDRHAGGGPLERALAAEVVTTREREVHEEVGGGEEEIEARPGNGENEVVEVQGAEEGESLPLDVEAAVAVQEPLPALPRDSAAEAEVLVEVRGLACGQGAPT